MKKLFLTILIFIIALPVFSQVNMRYQLANWPWDITVAGTFTVNGTTVIAGSLTLSELLTLAAGDTTEGFLMYDADADTFRINTIGFDVTDVDDAGIYVMAFKDGEGPTYHFSLDSLGNLTASGDISVGDDILLADGAVVGITGNEVITFNAGGSINFSGASVDIDGASTASSYVSDGDVTATNDVIGDSLTATTGFRSSGGALIKGLIDGNGTGATANNTLADTLDITGELTATTIVVTGAITDGVYTSDGSGNFTGVTALTTTSTLTAGGLLDGNGTNATVNNTMADSLEVTGQVDASTGFTDGTMTINGTGTITGVAAITSTLTTTTGFNQSAVAVTNASTYQVLAANTGRVHIIGDFAQVCTITLPANAAGLNYEFWYYGAAAETHDDTLKTAGNGNPFKGSVAFMDVANAISSVYPNGSSNSSMALNNMNGGTWFKVVSDGTYWYLTGSIVTDATPVFADQ